MDVDEPLVRDLDGSDPRIDCGGLLGELTRMTRLDELFDVSTKPWPIVVGSYTPSRLSNSSMVQMVMEVDDEAPF